jgi:hypothetical protein
LVIGTLFIPLLPQVKGTFTMTKSKILFISLFVLSALLISFTLIPAKPVNSKLDKIFTVRLYSGEKLMGSWQAIGEGLVDGDSYVFNTASTLEPRMVRIQGTYSVEQVQ